MWAWRNVAKGRVGGLLDISLRKGIRIAADIFPVFVAGGDGDQQRGGIGLADGDLPVLSTDCAAFVLDEHPSLEFQAGLNARGVAVLAVDHQGVAAFGLYGGNLRGGETGGEGDSAPAGRRSGAPQ